MLYYVLRSSDFFFSFGICHRALADLALVVQSTLTWHWVIQKAAALVDCCKQTQPGAIASNAGCLQLEGSVVALVFFCIPFRCESWIEFVANLTFYIFNVCCGSRSSVCNYLFFSPVHVNEKCGSWPPSGPAALYSAPLSAQPSLQLIGVLTYHSVTRCTVDSPFKSSSLTGWYIGLLPAVCAKLAFVLFDSCKHFSHSSVTSWFKSLC